MPKDLIKRYLPNPKSIRENPALRPLSKWLTLPDLWHLNRRSVSGAVFIGFFCAFLPVPFQMLVAAFLAIAFRCNLPISVALVWMTNPLTIGPMFYFAYRLGVWLLNMPESVTAIEFDWAWLQNNFDEIVYPLVFGSLVCGWVAGATAFLVVRVFWRMHVLQRWQERKARRLERKNQRARSAANAEHQSD